MSSRSKAPGNQRANPYNFFKSISTAQSFLPSSNNFAIMWLNETKLTLNYKLSSASRTTQLPERRGAKVQIGIMSGQKCRHVCYWYLKESFFFSFFISCLKYWTLKIYQLKNGIQICTKLKILGKEACLKVFGHKGYCLSIPT